MDKTQVKKAQVPIKKENKVASGGLLKKDSQGRNMVIPISISGNVKNKLEFGKF